MKKRDWILTILFIIAWGTNFTVIKIGIGNMPPMLLAALRFVFVAIPAVFFVKRPETNWYDTFGYALTIIIQFACLYYAIYIGMPAGLASVVAQSSSLITILLATLLFKEKMKSYQIIGLVVAVSGLTLIGFSTGSAGGLTIPLAGLFLTVIAAFFWSLSNIIVKSAANKAAANGIKLNTLGLVAWSSLVPPLPMLMLALTMDTPKTLLNASLHLSPTAIFSILFLAWCSTLFGASAWNYLLSKYDTGRVAPLSLMVPVAGLVIARIVLSEKLSNLQWAGSLVIIVGLAILSLGSWPIRGR